MAKNIDYSASAENLTNPESVRLLLLKRLGLNSKLAELQDELEMRNDVLITLMDNLNKELAANKSEIENAVQTDGGYQDVDAGLYALRQKRVSYTYNPAMFKEKFTTYATAVIKEVVDTEVLGRLIKGKLLYLDDLVRLSVATEKEAFAFIIRTDSQTKEK